MVAGAYHPGDPGDSALDRGAMWAAGELVKHAKNRLQIERNAYLQSRAEDWAAPTGDMLTDLTNRFEKSENMPLYTGAIKTAKRYWDTKHWAIGYGTEWFPGMPMEINQQQADALAKQHVIPGAGAGAQAGRRQDKADLRAVGALWRTWSSIPASWEAPGCWPMCGPGSSTKWARRSATWHAKVGGKFNLGVTERRIG